jgi:hypothetical protein
MDDAIRRMLDAIHEVVDCEPAESWERKKYRVLSLCDERDRIVLLELCSWYDKED